MRAIQIREYCGPEDLKLVEVAPSPLGAGEVRIRVRAADVQFADSLMISNQYQHKPPLPIIPGMACGGEVVEVAPDVRHLGVGDRVAGYARFGYWTEEAVMPATQVFRLPAAMDFVTAAAFPISYGTAHVGLKHRARLQPREVLLVNGAAGGVGIAAIEVGKALGAKVIAAASTPEKQALAKKHGADHVVNSREDVPEQVRAITDGIDVAFDPVGGEAFRAALKVIRFEGRIVVVGFAGGERQAVQCNHVLVKNCDVIGLSWSFYREKRLPIDQQAFADLCRMYEARQIDPPVTEVYPLGDAGKALRRLIDRSAMGKVVLTI